LATIDHHGENTMKNIATLSLALAGFALAGCAATNGASSPVAAAAPTSGTAYCNADRLDRGASALTCNWAKTAKEACESRATTSVATSRIAEGPSRGGMCSSGERLVYVTMK
jgi:hypothetical protein